ncbi:LrgB-like family-domain-containing protein [Xylaria sp. FL1042]|nr:LrgB-like family-domain-containing protein [Xylaria sp. FL1042]
MSTNKNTIASDLFVAVKLVARNSATQLIRAWLYVPIGIIAILATTFGVNRLLQLGAVSFPASVACLVVLFLGLLLLEKGIGEHRTRRIVAVLEIPGAWSLQWINVFFTPSFVLLPLSPPIGGIEVLKIIAVFVIGFLVMMALAAYMTRGLQLALGSSKRALTERAEELGAENDEIPMTAHSISASTPPTAASVSEGTGSADLDLRRPPRSRDPLPVRQHPQQGSRGSSQDGVDGREQQLELPAQIPPPPARATRWALAISRRLDIVVYAVLFVFVGIPIYYTTGYAMPAQLTFSVLTYFAALSIPPTWRQYLHPVLVSSLFTVLGLWVLGLTKSQSLEVTLREFRTGTTYLKLWDSSSSGSSGSGSGSSTPRPGAGDILASALDASIVSLALPMYQYRRELKAHFPSIVLPNVFISVASLFAYPYLCFAIGISAERSLAFAARSLTLALAIPAVESLGGDGNTVAALAITSGIVGVLVGRWMLGFLRIPEGMFAPSPLVLYLFSNICF